jgi:hypothetical protein
MNVRFIKPFVLFIIETYLDADGKMRTREVQHHIKFGESYPVQRVTPHGDVVDIQFDDDGPIKGMASNISKEYVEIMQPPGHNLSASKPCGCGKGKKK